MSESFHPAAERFWIAVESLATGTGDIKLRVAQAFDTIVVFCPAELPPHVRPDFEWVIRELTRSLPRGPWEGSGRASLFRRRKTSAAKIAQRIVHICRALAPPLHDMVELIDDPPKAKRRPKKKRPGGTVKR